MRMRAVVVQAILWAPMLTVPWSSVWAQQEEDPSGVRVATQIVAATAIGPVAFMGGGLATKWIVHRTGANEARERRAAYVGAWTLTGVATAAVPPLVLRGGNYPAALAGAVVGGAAGGVMVWTGRALFRDRARCGVVCTAWGIAAFALPATGATLLYDRSR